MTSSQVFETLVIHNGSFRTRSLGGSLQVTYTSELRYQIIWCLQQLLLSVWLKSLKGKSKCPFYWVSHYFTTKFKLNHYLIILKWSILHHRKNSDVGIFDKRSKSHLRKHSSNVFGVICWWEILGKDKGKAIACRKGKP